VNSWVRECACFWACKEILDKSAEVVEFEAGCVPSEEDFARVGLQLQCEHVLLIFNIDFNLLLGLGVRDRKAVADFDFHSIFGADPKKGADNAV
jgi:hypothetical protein